MKSIFIKNVGRLRIFSIVGLFFITSILHAQSLNYEQALDKIGSNISERLSTSNQKSATVLDITNLDGAATQLGRLISQDLTDRFISKTQNLSWIDRSQRDYVLKENKLAADKLMDPQTQKRIGKLIGVDTIIVGTATQLDQNVRLQVRAIEIETARVLASSSVTFALPDSMKSLSDRTVSAGSNNSSDAITTPTNVFRNKVLAVSSRSIDLTLRPSYRGGMHVTATIVVENLSGQDLWMGTHNVAIGGCAATVVNNSWNQNLGSITGIAGVLPSTWREDNKSSERRNSMTGVPAGGKVVVIANLMLCNTVARDSKTLPISIDLILDHFSKYQSMSIGIPDAVVTSSKETKE